MLMWQAEGDLQLGTQTTVGIRYLPPYTKFPLWWMWAQACKRFCSVWLVSNPRPRAWKKFALPYGPHRNQYYIVPERFLWNIIWTFESTGCRIHSVSYPVGNMSSFTWLKLPKHEADHPSPSSANIKKCGTTPPDPVMHLDYHFQHGHVNIALVSTLINQQ